MACWSDVVSMNVARSCKMRSWFSIEWFCLCMKSDWSVGTGVFQLFCNSFGVRHTYSDIVCCVTSCQTWESETLRLGTQLSVSRLRTSLAHGKRLAQKQAVTSDVDRRKLVTCHQIHSCIKQLNRPCIFHVTYPISLHWDMCRGAMSRYCYYFS